MDTTAANLDSNRPWYQRLTILGAAIFAGVQSAEAVGAVPPGTMATGSELVKIAGAFMATIGAYRQLAKK